MVDFRQVIARIYYCVNRSWSGRISLSELRRSNLLSVLKLLEDEDDINAVTQYFSYEHFYVIYCKFWELDRDHDLFIDRHDLARHSDHGEPSPPLRAAPRNKVASRTYHGTLREGTSASKEVGLCFAESYRPCQQPHD